MNRFDQDTDIKVRSSIRFLNETIQYNANEPSLAFYRIQEHVQKMLPTMIQKRNELENLKEQMNGLVFDIEYSMDAVKDVGTSVEHVDSIVKNLEKARYLSEQISLIRQKQIQQQLFEKKDSPLPSVLKI
ncbi:unnamed protein product [Adineta steineri]|uniref:Uncharacterized protein n=1 Tax=Adineta steineri TaxID=433720 RepID=A0A813TU79_9BILA|nr:unnamed protein product [Adineta steineri]CAF0858538.1 unnamed protein product [Adineta steineri]CAF0903335.1 unnamed protein product [Adineta steineri]CAF3523684.1 unnamed protein product [Adineta steineri]CAF3756881.1 unnamed protein product [Adineta steineri]